MIIKEVSHYDAELTEEERCLLFKCANLLSKIIDEAEKKNCLLCINEKPYKNTYGEDTCYYLNDVDLKNIKARLESLATLKGITKN